VISQLLKQVMQQCSLKQTDLAEVLEVSLSRVKSMTSGRVKNFTREEIERLVGKLDIRADWLVTGKGPMLQDDEPQEEFAERMRAINQGRALLQAMPLSDAVRARVGALLSGDPAQDGVLIADALIQAAPTNQRRGEGIGESAIHQAVLDAVDLLSLDKKVDAQQLAKAVVKLCARQSASTIATPENGAAQTINGPVYGVVGRDMVVHSNRGKGK
jgi:DNA-binding Xre family transcriptional regulator